MTRILNIFILALLLQCPLWGTTYYVCSVTGAPFNASDANAGTLKTATWLHAPGMPNFTGTYVHAAGDQIILCGGGVWHFSSGTPLMGGTWNWAHSGGNGDPDYLGVDLTFFTGGSWTRPIETMDNAPANSCTGAGGSCTLPSSCPTAADDANTMMAVTSQSWVTVDNIEFTGGCINGNPSGGYFRMTGSTHILVSNNYFHGHTATSNYTSDTFKFVNGTNSGVNTFNEVANNVFDNSDGTYGNRVTTSGGVSFCATTGAPTSANVCALGWAIGEGYSVHGNVVRHVSNGIESANATIVHDNLFEYIFSPLANSPHGNVFETLGGVPGATCQFYNNLTRNNSDGVTWWPQCDNAYIFNNVWENDWHNGGGANGNCLLQSPTRFSGPSGGASPTYFNVNNTTDSTCTISASAGNAFTPEWDNYTLTNIVGNGTTATVTCSTNCGNITTGALITIASNTVGGFNGTFQLASVTGAPATSFTFASSTNATGTGGHTLAVEFFQNDHAIGKTSVATLATCQAGSTCTFTDKGGQVFMTTGTATSQGYTLSNDFAPTAISNATVGAGINASASCATFSTDSALCSGTSKGVAEASGSGGLIASYPAIPINVRPTAWDAGAYQFAVASISQTINGVVQMSGSAVMK